MFKSIQSRKRLQNVTKMEGIENALGYQQSYNNDQGYAQNDYQNNYQDSEIYRKPYPQSYQQDCQKSDSKYYQQSYQYPYPQKYQPVYEQSLLPNSDAMEAITSAEPSINRSLFTRKGS